MAVPRGLPLDRETLRAPDAYADRNSMDTRSEDHNVVRDDT